eukprot:scaffold138827_cov51-Prasinocladus_malaysianus.AAC.1
MPSKCSTCGHTQNRWDGRKLPSPLRLTEEQNKTLLEMNAIDVALYEHAKNEWDKVVAKGGPLLAATTAEIRRQQKILWEHCHEQVYKNSSNAGIGNRVMHDGCLWLELDLEYEKIVDSHGWPDMKKPIRLQPSHADVVNQPAEKNPIDMLTAFNDFKSMYVRLMGGTVGRKDRDEM